jgi:7-carboxy-7-deazaguanine synthase
MRGDNPKRPPEHGDGQTLAVVEIFPTLQGEGPFVGQPAVFVRLGGCNLACSFCDTEFERFASQTLHHILDTVEASATEGASRARDLVVITGGEPMRQNIVPLCEALLQRGFRVQIETNGTCYLPLPKAVHVVCSPKATGGRYYPIREDVWELVDAIKFIICKEDPTYGDIGQVGQAGRDTPIYVQPMETGDPAQDKMNTHYTAALAQREGYYLSLQTHKLLEIP